MKRHRIISLSVLLALIGAVGPVALSGYIAWRTALGKEREKLGELAELSILRAQKAFAESHEALAEMAASPLAPCTLPHIAKMRSVVLASHYVVELGYFRSRTLLCTSWGAITPPGHQARTDFVTPDGLQVTARLRPLGNPRHPMMALQQGAYNALVNPAALTDIIVAPNVELAIATPEGRVLSSTGAAATALLSAAHPRPPADVLAGIATRPGWIAAATEPLSQMDASLQAERMQIMPFGVLASGLLVGMVVWVSRKRLSPLARLQLAVQRREFVVHYQPIVALASGVCVGAEALVRWQRDDGDLVQPNNFIALAEQHDLSMAIAEQVLRAVIRELGQLLAQEPSLHVAINVAAADIKSGRVHTMLARTLQGSGVDCRQIWVEATERSLMDIEAARETIRHLRAAGHSVAIDDFGTGYSSLQYLQGLPMDALKIDKSFVDTIGTNSATSSVTSHIIEMAKTLELLTIAEGVERQEQLDYLREHAVDMAQGWLFSRALPAAAFVAYHAQVRAAGALPPAPA